MANINLGRVGFVNKGTWTDGIHKINDVVRYVTGIYACIVAHTSVAGDITPYDDTYWQKWADISDLNDRDFFHKPNPLSTLFVKTAPAGFSIPSGFKVSVNGVVIELAADYPLSLNTDLDVDVKVAGKDYYVYAKDDATFYISLDKTITADRLIGGFHYSITPEDEAPTGNKTESVMVIRRGIHGDSFWDLKWKPSSGVPEGRVYGCGKWSDIYLMDTEYAIRGYSSPFKLGGVATAKIAGGAVDANGRGFPLIPIAYGGDGTINYGKFTWFNAAEIAASCGMELPSYELFQALAYGVSEGQSSQINAYETVAGNIEHYANLSSRYWEQASGTQWVWSRELANGYGTTDFAWRTGITDSRGNIYATSNAPVAAILGGVRDEGVNAGSRASVWSHYVWNTHWYIGARFVCDHVCLP